MTKKRYACLWFPNWPIQRLESVEPRFQTLPLTLFEQRPGRGEFVTLTNRWAAQAGVRSGMPVSEAQTLCPDRRPLKLVAVNPELDRILLERLAVLAQQFSPLVALNEAEEPDALLLDLTGVAHLYGGESEWAKSVCATFVSKGFQLQCAVAETIGAAWALAHGVHMPNRFRVLPAGELDRLNALSIETLRLNPEAHSVFHRLGIDSIGQLLALNRNSLVSRVGRAVTKRIGQFLGDIPELLTPYLPPPIFRERRQFEHPLTQSHWIEEVSLQLLKRLLQRLAKQQLGLSQLHVVWQGEMAGTQLAWMIDLGRPTVDEPLLIELCQMKWERAALSFAVASVQMTAKQVGRLQCVRLSLFDEHQIALRKDIDTLVTRLHGRLGSAHVSHLELVPDAIPEHQTRLRSAIESSEIYDVSFDAGMVPQLWERPLLLAAFPQPVDVLRMCHHSRPAVIKWQGQLSELHHVWGPERVESGWWRRAVRRDYYRVETHTGQRWWIFQRLDTHQWFLHGEIL
ncbi:MAG: DNA polymerase Y family protein [Planctomycetaceae bacterium]|nr:DNA polymerase Y family protein [Planctomycetaceae bacterium]